jgi:hypothetical protein
MKRTSLFAAFCMIGLLMLPQAARANMVDLSDDQLCEVTGQAGIIADATRFIIDTHMETMPAINRMLTLSDVTIKGTIDIRNSTASDLVAQVANPMGMMGIGMPGFDMMGMGTMSVGVHKIDTAIDLERFSVGAIHIGSDVTGPSLGSLDILGMHADIKGTIAISTH